MTEPAPAVGRADAADPLAPYDAVLVLSYGGPAGPADVLPFMRNATAGRGVPDSRLLEVCGHYAGFDGVSPINARNAEMPSSPAAARTRRWSSATATGTPSSPRPCASWPTAGPGACCR